MEGKLLQIPAADRLAFFEGSPQQSLWKLRTLVERSCPVRSGGAEDLCSQVAGLEPYVDATGVDADQGGSKSSQGTTVSLQAVGYRKQAASAPFAAGVLAMAEADRQTKAAQGMRFVRLFAGAMVLAAHLQSYRMPHYSSSSIPEQLEMRHGRLYRRGRVEVIDDYNTLFDMIMQFDLAGKYHVDVSEARIPPGVLAQGIYENFARFQQVWAGQEGISAEMAVIPQIYGSSLVVTLFWPDSSLGM